MTTYILRRLAVTPLLLIAVSFTVFTLVRMVPGDPADIILGEKGSAEARAQIIAAYGLDRPILVQYLIYMERAVLHLDLGTSYIRAGQSIGGEIRRRFPATVELTLAAMAVATFAGVALGVVAAVWRGSLFDHAAMIVALLGVSVPVFWLGLLLLIAFGGVLATGGNLDPRYSVSAVTGLVTVDALMAGDLAAFADALRHLILPAAALATIPLAFIARITRASMLEVLDSDFVRTARAKGVAEEDVVMKHALRNALIPIVTLGGIEFGYLLGGAVLTETVFHWPGMGTYIIDSVANRDYLAIQGAVMTLALLFVVVNLIVDVVYAVVDPRIRYD